MLRLISLISVLLITMNLSYAENLGTYGHVFPIAEENMLTWIHDRLMYLKKTGELQKLQNQALEDVKKSILRPNPVGLSTTNNPHIFYYTPSFTLKADIKDANGNVLYPKGLTVNPLDVSTYPPLVRKYHPTAPVYDKLWIFFNSDDHREVNWLKKEIKQLNQKHQYYKLIMTGGDVKDASLLLNSRVYFDQYGRLTEKIGIRHVPSIMEQEGVRFKITEINVTHESDVLRKNHKLMEQSHA